MPQLQLIANMRRQRLFLTSQLGLACVQRGPCQRVKQPRSSSGLHHITGGGRKAISKHGSRGQ
ncbi:hypothetical protein P153DRAFT_177197 [Dothidotthia symphoricarpi CBS 119687]|uniref:Uncharacterized protein n=1 Tax=Dothidotthia symphoricarpi CBS 119687 TaxID=1392245 RepID=A0A6A6ALV6_9PLEO|nr:uncharacterized protein P153DRAFT_177197 [Dothidotthia symphoricarpi CBS 119687]KAF2132962.1 hypothetical protein P153DRAFT_177197 [Dothidotthia symphoricarpi CBS 119687]